MPEENKVVKKGWLDKFLDWLERVCNKLPDSLYQHYQYPAEWP